VTDADGNREWVLKGGTLSLPRKIACWLFGEPTEILVLTPGQSVESVEIREISEGGVGM
jgi:hypothetical protein